jgi:hypothetical protein
MATARERLSALSAPPATANVRWSRRGLILAALFGVTLAGLTLGLPERAEAWSTTCQERHPTIIGTPGDDVLTGTPGADVILGLGGDDVIAGTGTIDVVQPGLVISGLSDTRPVGANDVFNVPIGIPNSAGTSLSGFQGVSAASAPLALTLSSSDGAVGEFQPRATFVPLAAGTTTVAASIPGFLSTTTASRTVTVTGP